MESRKNDENKTIHQCSLGVSFRRSFDFRGERRSRPDGVLCSDRGSRESPSAGQIPGHDSGRRSFAAAVAATFTELQAAARNFEPGARIEVTLRRDTARTTVPVVLQGSLPVPKRRKVTVRVTEVTTRAEGERMFNEQGW